MFLPKIFKGPLWILPRSLRIFKDPGKEIEDPQGSLSSRIFEDPLLILAKILRILNFLAKIFEDLQRSSSIL